MWRWIDLGAISAITTAPSNHLYHSHPITHPIHSSLHPPTPVTPPHNHNRRRRSSTSTMVRLTEDGLVLTLDSDDEDVRALFLGLLCVGRLSDVRWLSDGWGRVCMVKVCERPHTSID